MIAWEPSEEHRPLEATKTVHQTAAWSVHQSTIQPAPQFKPRKLRTYRGVLTASEFARKIRNGRATKNADGTYTSRRGRVWEPDPDGTYRRRPY